MLTKFETKSNRVKGLAFHPKRPWILSSLHTGAIQLWDYRMGTLLERFEEHEGPVRGVDFHKTQPLFVSGGDDYKIKVWNYKLRRCLFTLVGHLDYIRTVQFHNEQPWIVSASDDQTIRVWNWQSRQCISVLTGHNHYVMCASFHPKEDLIVSASLDQTVRVWDISGLKKKSPPTSGEDALRMSTINAELFGTNEGVVKYILEGHDRGVNWVSFHPTLPLIISGADDRVVKLWRMNETKAWEVDSLRGHSNNVSCAMFHPRADFIISNSEDKSIRVWDLNKRTPVHTFRREHDRFWVLAVHPEQNLIAAGHDSGLVVFKLERERPAFTIHQNSAFYVKDKSLRMFDLASSRDSSLTGIRKPTGPGNSAPRSMSFNPAEGLALISSDAEGGSYEMYSVKSDNPNPEVKGQGICAVFVARDKFAVIDKTKQILVKTLKNEVKKKITAPVPSVDALFHSLSGSVLIKAEDKIFMFDFVQKQVVAEVAAPGVKYVVWSPDYSRVALISKHAVVICNKKLEQTCSVHETIRVKSGAFDESGVFVYTTLNHMKYCLPDGDHGIVKTLEAPIYLIRVKGNTVHYIDRDSKVSSLQIDATEYKFKMALMAKKYDEILRVLKDSRLQGQAIIAYLQRKGFPEVALHFVKDDLVRFNLAISCGNLDIATEVAKKLDTRECWTKLAQEALRQGNHQTVEMAYQKTKDFERLSFLYLITGNTEKLRKMLQIAEMRGDVMGRFHNALYLGDAQERVRILSDVGQANLALATAVSSGLTEQADSIKEKLGGESGIDSSVLAALSALTTTTGLPPPPPAQLSESNWPLLTVSKSFLEGALAGGSSSLGLDTDIDVGAAGAGGWDSDLVIPDGTDATAAALGADLEAEETGPKEASVWDDLDALDIPDVGGASAVAGGAREGGHFYVPPNPAPSPSQRWSESQLAADHAAAGDLSGAMQILHRTIGAVNFAPLKPLFSTVFTASHAVLPVMPLLPPISHSLARTFAEERTWARQPALPISMPSLVEKLKAAYKATTEGKFQEAKTQFLYIMHSITLLVVETKAEVAEVKELLGICREYVTAITLELTRKDLVTGGGSAQRALELAAYFTHCNLQPVHLILSLRSAQAAAYKLKNFQTAASFAKRLLELNPGTDAATQARKIVQFAETNPKNELSLAYDERNPFVVCCHSLSPIYRGSDLVRCPYCFAPYQPQYKGKLCSICQISEIGADTVGLVCSAAQQR